METTIQEVYKDIDGYKDKYQVSNLGNIKSKHRYKNNHSKLQEIKETIKLQNDNGNGYKTTNLWENNKGKTLYVHRLVVEAFIGKIPKDMQINHIDGNKSNNNIHNLEIVTRSENVIHAYRNGLNHGTFGISQSRSKTGLSNINPKLQKERDFGWIVCLRIDGKRYERKFKNIYEAMVYHNSVVREKATNKKQTIHYVTDEILQRYGTGLCSYNYNI